jgi:hypothetical protein
MSVASYYLTCDGCFVRTDYGRDVPVGTNLVWTADHLLHALEFEDDHVVQMRCESRYLPMHVLSIGEPPRSQTSEDSGRTAVSILAAVMLAMAALFIGILIGSGRGF